MLKLSLVLRLVVVPLSIAEFWLVDCCCALAIVTLAAKRIIAIAAAAISAIAISDETNNLQDTFIMPRAGYTFQIKIRVMD